MCVKKSSANVLNSQFLRYCRVPLVGNILNGISLQCDYQMGTILARTIPYFVGNHIDAKKSSPTPRGFPIATKKWVVRQIAMSVIHLLPPAKGRRCASASPVGTPQFPAPTGVPRPDPPVCTHQSA